MNEKNRGLLRINFLTRGSFVKLKDLNEFMAFLLRRFAKQETAPQKIGE